LGGNMKYEIEPNSDMRFIYMFSAIALFVLIIASLNFTNLSVARSGKRTVEVGVRKVVGAEKSRLVGQFLGESVVFAVLAYGISILVVSLVLATFNSLIERNLSLSLAADGTWLLTFLGAAVLVGLLSGSYPAFLVSSFSPLQIIKRTPLAGSKNAQVFRRSLVVTQFAASIGLLVCAFVIHSQLRFIRIKDLGFDRKQVVTLYTVDTALKRNPEPLKQELLKNPRILGVTASLDLPTTIRRSTTVSWDDHGKPKTCGMDFTCIDEDFLGVYGIPVKKGRNFSTEFPTDGDAAVILNATAAREFGGDDPVGRKVTAAGREWTVIGVIEDFNFQSLHWRIDPLICVLTKGREADYYSLKVRAEDIPGTLAFIERKWKEFSPEFPFQFSFLDERIEKLYKAEHRLGRSVTIFAFVALVIACSGLFGLVSYLVEQKRKEIGIRRVLGADFGSVIVLLTQEYAKCLALAAAIAWPVGYWIMRLWLRNFVYRTDIGLGVFLVSGLVAVVFALGTVGYQSAKAALANPVDSLRHE
jgi:putative ABC transport system permease protein